MNRFPTASRCPTSMLELAQIQRLVVPVALALLLAACGTKATATEDSGPTEGSDTAADTPPEDIQDTASDDIGSDAVGTDAVTDTPKDVPDIEVVVKHECEVDSDCFSKINPICQTISCVNYTCTAPAKKEGANVCCADIDCAELSCQTAACNVSAGQCEYKPTPNCCADKSTILPKVKFESIGNLEGFSGAVTTTATGSTVAWQVSNKRAHTGKSSLYLGNECYNYDTSATTATSCQSTGAGAKVTAKLTSPELVIPKDASGKVKPAILHYWLWLDAEPAFLAGNAGLAGTSCTSCAIDQVCVNLGNGAKDACLTEKDVLTVFVNGAAVTPTPVWASTKIGKTTGGQWVHRVVNLAGFGASATVTWQFATLDGVNNGFEGVYLDDIVVETLCATDSSSCDKATPCANGNGNPCAINDCTYYDNVTDKGICFADLTPGCCAGVADCQDGNLCTIDACLQANGAATGLCSNVPDAKNPQCCLPSNLFTDGMENGISAWKNIGSNSTAVSWRVNPTGGTSGSKSLVFTDSTFQSYADPKLLNQGPKGTICSPEVQLGSGTLYDVASFQVALITEWCGQPAYSNPPGSQKPCKISTDCTGGESCNTILGICTLAPALDKLTVTFQTGGQYCGASECSNIVSNIKKPLWSSDDIKGCTDGKYLEVDVALDQYAGKKGRVCFTFDAGDPSGNTFAGPSIDDFKVDIACEKKQCTNDAFCDALGLCKPTAETGICQADGQCGCKSTGKCAKDLDCDDKDTCTVDTCVQGKCDWVLAAGCCSEKTQVTNESFESSKGTTLPTGWTTAFATAAVSATGDPYDQTMQWHISADNFFGTSPDLYSLYFGNTLGNYDAGSQKVPYGIAKSAPVTIPLNGTTIITFHLNLSTEWDAPAVFAVPQYQSTIFAVDRLRFGFVDPSDPTNITWAWSSYDIGGTTNGQWATISVKAPAAVAGKTMLLAWEFDAGNPKNNNHVGPYIDGINMWTTCTPPICVSGIDCQPPTPDACKSYNCKFDEPTKAFSCETPFKSGPGCCQPTSPLPSVTFESAALSPMVGSATPGILTKWSAVPHKYLNGKFEAYFGNPAKWNYDDPVAGCGPVQSDFDSPVLKIGTNAKQSAQLQFAIYADIEQPSGTFQTEHFKVIVKTGAQSTVIWDATDPVYGLKPSQFKTKQNITLPLTKYQGLNIVVEFHFDSGDCSLNDKYEGVFLDDIQVTEPCTQ